MLVLNVFVRRCPAGRHWPVGESQSYASVQQIISWPVPLHDLQKSPWSLPRPPHVPFYFWRSLAHGSWHIYATGFLLSNFKESVNVKKRDTLVSFHTRTPYFLLRDTEGGVYSELKSTIKRPHQYLCAIFQLKILLVTQISFTLLHFTHLRCICCAEFNICEHYSPFVTST